MTVIKVLIGVAGVGKSTYIEKQSFPYTEIEEIDRTYQLVSPYIKETIEKREASVIVTLPDDFVEELKAFVHKEDKKEPLQHIVN